MININGKRYNTWNTHLQEIFNEKIEKFHWMDHLHVQILMEK